jgi:Outer membrane protein beta-barrel domain
MPNVKCSIAQMFIDRASSRSSAPPVPSGTTERVMPQRKLRLVRARALAALLGVLALWPAEALAQETLIAASRIDLSGTYSFLHTDSADIGGPFNLNGGSTALAYNLNNHFSVIADFGAYRFSGLPGNLASNLFTYQFGPRFTARKFRRVTPFAQVLLGGARVTASSGDISAGENAFSMSVGGGLDLPLHHRFSLRLVQADYLLTRFPNLNTNSATENHLRVSAGIVFHFSSRE